MSSKKKNKISSDKSNFQKIASTKTSNKKALWIAGSIIAVTTFLIYLPVFSNGFVNWDDDRYIQKQQLIQSFNFKALFIDNKFVMGNFHPLVMTVYSVIYHFFQLNPVAYHTVNLILHIINSCLVLWLLFYLTGSVQLSFIVGLLFGIHPLHVESVAWASELKDLMYALGFLSSLIFYVRYVKEKQAKQFYALSLLLFLFSLLSKGMGVSLTAVLFLTDFYLGRKFTFKTISEKIPFFILSLIFGVVAIIAQRSLGAIQDIVSLAFIQRVALACYGFITYIIQLIVPFNLSPFYPYPLRTGENLSAEYYAYPFLVLILLIAVFYSLRKTGKILFGVGFFTVTVFIVLQLIPVGVAIMADRYTYIPSIGIFYLIAEGAIYLSKRGDQISIVTKVILFGFILFLSFRTFNQVKIWKDGESLWSKVINKYPDVVFAYNSRGIFYESQKDFDRALTDFSTSLQKDSTQSDIWNKRGMVLKEAGELERSLADFKQSLRLKTENADAWNNAGTIYLLKGMTDSLFLPEALFHFNKALHIKSTYAQAYSNRGGTYAKMRRHKEAISDFTHAIELDLRFADAFYNRGIIYYNLGRKEEACPDLKRAAELGYGHAAEAYRDLCK